MSPVPPKEPLQGNKLGITDWQSLDTAARLLAQFRADQVFPPETKDLTYEGFKAIHRHLFQDVFPWAGQERTQESSNPQARRLFADPSEIKPQMEAAFAAFRRQDELKGLDATEFSQRAARFISGINEAHPFNDGNGRTQRAWLSDMAERAGHRFEIGPDDRDAWNTAARKAFNSRELEHMSLLIEARIRSPDRAPDLLTQNAARADQFLTLTRDQALATGDATLKVAWANLDTIRSVVARTHPPDTVFQERIVKEAVVRIADQIRTGQPIQEVRIERDAPGQSIATPQQTPVKDRDR